MKPTVRAWLALIFAGVYLLNPGMGLFELIPDGMPIIGNLDEAAATALFLWGLRELRAKAKEGNLK